MIYGFRLIPIVYSHGGSPLFDAFFGPALTTTVIQLTEERRLAGAGDHDFLDINRVKIGISKPLGALLD